MLTPYFYERHVKDPYEDYTCDIYENVSNTDVSFLAVATKLAYTSSNRFKIGALIVKSGRVLGGSANITKQSPWTPPRRFSTHAEIAALKVASKTKGATMYVSRLSSTNTLALAKPCSWCMQKILENQIYRVVYTTNDSIPNYFYTSTVKWSYAHEAH